jgi:hypothetical protein
MESQLPFDLSSGLDRHSTFLYDQPITSLERQFAELPLELLSVRIAIVEWRCANTNEIDRERPGPTSVGPKSIRCSLRFLRLERQGWADKRQFSRLKESKLALVTVTTKDFVADFRQASSRSETNVSCAYDRSFHNVSCRRFTSPYVTAKTYPVPLIRMISALPIQQLRRCDQQ